MPCNTVVPVAFWGMKASSPLSCMPLFSPSTESFMHSLTLCEAGDWASAE